VVVTLDADMQHPPSLVPSLIQPIREGLADFVIGSRERSKSSMSWARRTSNFLTSFMVSRRIRKMIPDSQSGFRAIRMHFLRDMELTTSRYETETEILIKAADAGARFAFVPIPTIYAGETSSIRHVRDTLRFIRLFLRML